MKETRLETRWKALAGCLVMAACAGKNLNEVGDVNGPSGGTGADAGNGGHSSGSGGKPNGTGGKPNGTGGTVGPVDGDAGQVGAGGVPEGPGFVCETCELVAETPSIRDVWAGPDHVYWIEYGSADALDNYQDDGRLMALPLDGGVPSVVADDLQGPTRLCMSQSFAYVIVDRSSAADGPYQLTQVSLETGDTRDLQLLPDDLNGNPTLGGGTLKTVDWCRRLFTANSRYAFWRNGDSVYRLDESSNAEPEAVATLGDEWLSMLLADESSLYLYYPDRLEARPLAGGDATILSAPNSLALLTLVGDDIYAHQGGSGANYLKGYVGRLPKTGGAFERLSETSLWVAGWRTDGQSYAADFTCSRYLDSEEALCRLGEGTIDDSAPIRLIATSAPWKDEEGERPSYWRAWDATPSAFFIGYDNQLYRAGRD